MLGLRIISYGKEVSVSYVWEKACAQIFVLPEEQTVTGLQYTLLIFLLVIVPLKFQLAAHKKTILLGLSCHGGLM